MKRRVRVAAMVGIAVALSTTVAAPAPAAAAPGCASSSKAYTGSTPWAQRLIDPGQVWPLTTGAGVVVAVLGTGVDVTNPQFGPGQVIAGADFMAPARSTTVDCDGRGTFAAGIIAAKPHEATTFAGVAPSARILSIRYTEHQTQGSNQVHPDRLAAAINAAVTGGADVICVLAPAAAPTPALRAALSRARAANAIVVSPAVASAGTSGSQSYPTAEPHVLAVGAIAANGEVASREAGDYLDLAAPGQDLVSTAPGSGRKPRHVNGVNDPAFAAAYVAGAAALVRSYRPKLSAEAVMERLRRTASRVSGDKADPEVGWGIVNPYAAVTAEGIDASTPLDREALPTAYEPAQPAAVVDHRARVSVAVAVGGIGLAALLGLGVQVYRRGRNRGWHPTRRSLADYRPIRNRK